MYSRHLYFKLLIFELTAIIQDQDLDIQNILQAKNSPASNNIAQMQDHAGILHAQSQQYYSCLQSCEI